MSSYLRTFYNLTKQIPPKYFQALGDFFDYVADIRRSSETWKHLPAVDSNLSVCFAE